MTHPEDVTLVREDDCGLRQPPKGSAEEKPDRYRRVHTLAVDTEAAVNDCPETSSSWLLAIFLLLRGVLGELLDLIGVAGWPPLADFLELLGVDD